MASSICYQQKIKIKQMKRALQILTHKGIINGEQHLLPTKNKN